MEEKIENSLSMGGEGEINNGDGDSEKIELPNISTELPNLSDVGSDKFEALKQSAEGEKGFGKFLSNSLENIAIDARDAIDNVFQGNELENIQSQVQNRQLELRERANNVTVVGDNTEETNVMGSGEVADASSLLVVPSGNSDNPYLINSYMQYNIVL
jgi:hypothetical protein